MLSNAPKFFFTKQRIQPEEKEEKLTYTASSLDILAVFGEVNCPERLSSRLCEMVEDWCE
jgi:hypothetical protein